MPKFICIEGLDGTGKNTIARTLVDELTQQGWKVQLWSFPDYESPTGIIIRNALNGVYGDFVKMSPEFCSELYALDRLAYIKEHPVDENVDFYILDRSYFSNFMYQGCKIRESDKIAGNTTVIRFLNWLSMQYEYEFIYTGLDKYVDNFRVIYLYISEEDRKKQIENRSHLDLHESNSEYLSQVAAFTTEWVFSDKSDMEFSIGRHISKNFDGLARTWVKDGMNMLKCYKKNVFPVEIQHYTDENKDEIMHSNIANVMKVLYESFVWGDNK